MAQRKSSGETGAAGAGFTMTGHAGLVRPARHGLVDEHRQLELQHDEIVILYLVPDPGNLLHGHRAVRAGADDDAVVRAGFGDLECDGGNAGRIFGVHNDAGHIHTGGGRRRDGLAAIGIVTDTADHRDVRAEARALHGLVRALSAGAVRKLRPITVSPEFGAFFVEAMRSMTKMPTTSMRGLRIIATLPFVVYFCP